MASQQNEVENLTEKIIGGRNERGIPSAVFIENVEKFLSDLNISSIEPLIGAEQQLYSKYKFMEANLMKSREMFKKRIPETEKDLEMLQHLMLQASESRPLKTTFSLADNVYAKATVDPSCNTVCIWLGVSDTCLSSIYHLTYLIGECYGRILL